MHPESPVCSCLMGSLLECRGLRGWPRLWAELRLDPVGGVASGHCLGAEGAFALCALGIPPPPARRPVGEKWLTCQANACSLSFFFWGSREGSASLGAAWHLTDLPHHTWGAPSEQWEGEGQGPSNLKAWHVLLGSFKNRPNLSPRPQRPCSVVLGWYLGIGSDSEGIWV